MRKGKEVVTLICLFKELRKTLDLSRPLTDYVTHSLTDFTTFVENTFVNKHEFMKVHTADDWWRWAHKTLVSETKVCGYDKHSDI